LAEIQELSVENGRSEVISQAGTPIDLRYHLDNAGAQARLQRLGELIGGFETPYGMELLASVHWVATHADPPARSPEEAVTAIYQGSPRKAKGVSAEHIKKAWQQPAAQGWIDSPFGAKEPSA
jgi:hypothetical protein